MKKLYVGNLPFTATEEEITQLFGEHGTVHSVALITDREKRAVIDLAQDIQSHLADTFSP